MNKKYLYIGMIMVGAACCTACTQSTDGQEVIQDNEVRITGKLGGGEPALLRSGEAVTNDLFADGATIGVYAYKTGESAYAKGGINHQYTCASQVFTGQAGETLYWPTKGNLNFVAYSPYQSSMSAATSVSTDLLYPLDIANQQTAMATDVLFASKEDVGGSHEPISLTFHHTLAKLNILLDGAFGMEFVAQPIIQVKGLKAQATMKMSLTGASVVFANPASAVDMVPFRPEDATTRRDSVSMLVIPQTMDINGETEFIYIQNGTDKYKFKLKPGVSPVNSDNKLVFEAGKEYKLTLTLKNKEAEITNALVSISEWVDGGTADGNGDASWPEINN